MPSLPEEQNQVEAENIQEPMNKLPKDPVIPSMQENYQNLNQEENSSLDVSAAVQGEINSQAQLSQPLLGQDGHGIFNPHLSQQGPPQGFNRLGSPLQPVQQMGSPLGIQQPPQQQPYSQYGNVQQPPSSYGYPNQIYQHQGFNQYGQPIQGAPFGNRPPPNGEVGYNQPPQMQGAPYRYQQPYGQQNQYMQGHPGSPLRQPQYNNQYQGASIGQQQQFPADQQTLLGQPPISNLNPNVPKEEQDGPMKENIAFKPEGGVPDFGVEDQARLAYEQEMKDRKQLEENENINQQLNQSIEDTQARIEEIENKMIENEPKSFGQMMKENLFGKSEETVEDPSPIEPEEPLDMASILAHVNTMTDAEAIKNYLSKHMPGPAAQPALVEAQPKEQFPLPIDTSNLGLNSDMPLDPPELPPMGQPYLAQQPSDPYNQPLNSNGFGVAPPSLDMPEQRQESYDTLAEDMNQNQLPNINEDEFRHDREEDSEIENVRDYENRPIPMDHGDSDSEDAFHDSYRSHKTDTFSNYESNLSDLHSDEVANNGLGGNSIYPKDEPEPAFGKDGDQSPYDIAQSNRDFEEQMNNADYGNSEEDQDDLSNEGPGNTDDMNWGDYNSHNSNDGWGDSNSNQDNLEQSEYSDIGGGYAEDARNAHRMQSAEYEAENQYDQQILKPDPYHSSY